MFAIAAHGVALFLFIPLVLFLLLRQPIGPGWSVAVGLVLVVGHRFLAAPWMAKFADVRCLWCGRVGHGLPVPVVAGGRQWQMQACSAAHEASVARSLEFAFRYRVVIGLGIFLPLAWLVIASVVSAAGHPLLPHAVNALVFRVVVAATVVSASLLPFVRSAGVIRSPSPVLRCPFPLHNLFLLGIGNTFWVFRLVGAWWLIDGVVRLAG